MQQEVLVLDAIHAVQEKHHGCLVVRHEGCRHLWLNQCAIYRPGWWDVSLCFYPASLPQPPPPPPTFAQSGDLQWEADDAHKVIQGHERPEDGTDPQGFTLTGLNQLEMVDRVIIGVALDNSARSGTCSILTIDALMVKQTFFVYMSCMHCVHVYMLKAMCVHMYVCARVHVCGCTYVHLLWCPHVKARGWLMSGVFLHCSSLFLETGSLSESEACRSN